MNEQLIFFALIILFSVLDGIVRKKKKQGQIELPGEVEGGWQPDEVGREEVEPDEWPDRDRAEPPMLGGELTPYEARRTAGRYEAPTTASDYDAPTTVAEYRRRGGGGSSVGGSGRGSARVDAESVWEEIARLARSGGAAGGTGAAAGSGGEGRVGGDARAGGNIRVGGVEPSAEVTTVVHRARAEHPIHLSHAGYGTDPSSRPSTAAVVTHEQSSADVRAVKRMLAGGRGQLRRAVILQEMLGPPVSLRDDAGGH